MQEHSCYQLTGTPPGPLYGLICATKPAPDAGEVYAALAGKFPATPIGKGLAKTGGLVQVSEEAFLRDFANDVPVSKARALYAVPGHAAGSLSTARTSGAARHTKPSWYAVSSGDRTANADLQRTLAKRMGAHTIEVASGHVSMISHPAEISQLILDGFASQK